MRDLREPTPGSSCRGRSSRVRPPAVTQPGLAALVAALLATSCSVTGAGAADTASASSDSAAASPDSTAGPAFRYEASGWWPAKPPSDSWRPSAVLVLPGSGIVVADQIKPRLFLLGTAGAEPVRLPVPDAIPVEWTALAQAPGLAFYALDGPGRAVHQYDYRGNYAGLAADLEAVSEEFGLGPVEPAGLAVDGAGKALVSDRLGDRLLVFGPGWSFLGTWGETGSDPGAWRRPAAVAVGRRAPYLVADTGNRRVVLLDELGGVVGTRGFEEPVDGVAVLGRDRYAISHGRTVEICGADLATLARVLLEAGEGCTKPPYATAALAGDATAVYAGEGCTGRVLQIRRAGD